jgi:uroporphyrinogen-III synthase
MWAIFVLYNNHIFIMSVIKIYAVGQGSKKKISELAKKKEISESEYCKHVLLEHLRDIEEKKK